MKRGNSIGRLACTAIAAAIGFAFAPPTLAQEQPADTSWVQAAFSQQQLDQMLAPIALYPDELLAQVMMAATYPREVTDAWRFLQSNPGLSGDALADAVERMPWDASVQALTQFPSVLAMMNEHPGWTGQLGDAFLGQREQVMDTVQALRARARTAGTLQSNERQQVIVREQAIVIEPVQAGGLWVPYYNPAIVYGPWWWPAYPPFLWVPPVAYRPPHFAEVFTIGFAWGPFIAVRSTLWHAPRPVWHHRHVIVTRPGLHPPAVWRHDPVHRRGVAYRMPPRDRFEPGSGPDWRPRGGPDGERRDRIGPDRPDRRGDGRPDREWSSRRDGRGDASPRPDREWSSRRGPGEGVSPRPDRVRPDRARPDNLQPGNVPPDRSWSNRRDPREGLSPRPEGRRGEFRPGSGLDDTRRRQFDAGRPRAPETTPPRVQKPFPAARPESARPSMTPRQQAPQLQQPAPPRPPAQIRQPSQGASPAPIPQPARIRQPDQMRSAPQARPPARAPEMRRQQGQGERRER
ncbi:MAG: DUF3300 domain-containing protein [Burkholderiaceae bacterium]|nr:DUF3300 domain-containing protein [Burkholderiaceae bacterium]